MRKIKKVFCVALVAAFVLSCMNFLPYEQVVNAQTAYEDYLAGFADPSAEYDAGVRWELPLGNTTTAGLESQLESFAAAGISVVEVTATGQPTGVIPEGAPNAGENYAAVYGMGTEAWSRALQTILRKANELGIRVDFHVSVNNGSNKHVPGLSPNDDAASKKLYYVNTAVSEGAMPDISEIAPAAKTYVSNVDGSTQPLDQNLYAVLLVNITEKGKTVETLYQLDNSNPTRGKMGYTNI